MQKNSYKELIKFGGNLNNKTNNILGIAGALIILLIWYLITLNENIIPAKILPTPISVFKGFKDLYYDYHLFQNLWYSVSLNLTGYVYALSGALPLGFIIGIYALPKGLFQKYTDALRYLPPPAITGIFIAIFSVGFGMKVAFLAFAIFIYLLPSVIQKINDLQNPQNDKEYVFIQTIKTLGASNLQKFTKVYFPYVIGKVFTDIIYLTAISWTYVVICETLNKEGGVGAMIYNLNRQSLVPLVYGVLFTIILTGIAQDFILKELDNTFFPYKYEKVSLIRKFISLLKKLIFTTQK